MELVNYRFSLDMKKSGVQRVLQGFTTGDGMLRRLTINLKNNGETVNLDESYSASMYILPEGATESTINACTIVNDTIVYDVEKNDVANTGTTKMQLQIITSSGVTYCPQFALEVNANLFEDGDAYAAKFSELELALAQALYVYRHRIVSVDLADDGTFTVTYGDGTTYVSDTLKEFMNYWEDKIKKYESWMAQNVDAGLYDEDFNLIASWDALVSSGNVVVSGTESNVIVDSSTITDATYPDAYYLYIPDTVVRIDSAGFTQNNCKYIHIPSTVSYIGTYAFYKSTNLKEINIPSSIGYIADGMFCGCTSLSICKWNPNSPTYIGDYAFAGTAFTSYPFSDISLELNAGAFSGCTSMTSIDLDNVSLLYNYSDYIASGYRKGVFSNCTSLTSISNFGTNNEIEILGGSSMPGAFYGCTSLASVEVGENVVMSTNEDYPSSGIPKYTFMNCTSLAEATIPLCMISGDIGDYYTFYGCSSLETINVVGYGYLDVQSSGVITRTTPSILGTIARAADNPPIVTFEMDENVSVDSVSAAFNGFTSLTSLTINWNATPTISSYAFANCTAIDDITVPSDVASVDDDSFLNVAHITYAGALDTSNWGALSYN